MTVDEWINKQRKLIGQLVNGDVLFVAALETHRTMANRIFVEGKNAIGANTGKYNTTNPLYVNPKNSPRGFATGGKNGSKKKNGSAYKTRYFKSYSAYRAAIGRQNAKVDLNLSGQLQSDFVAGIRRNGNSEVLVVLKNPVNQKKRRGNEKKFGKIFSLTKAERMLFIEENNKGLKKLINA